MSAGFYHGADRDRRALIELLLAGAVACAVGCRASETPEAGLARLFDLDANELQVLDALSEPERHELYTNLIEGGEVTGRTVDLVMKLIGSRSAVFAFVGYGIVPPRMGVCGGLLRE